MKDWSMRMAVLSFNGWRHGFSDEIISEMAEMPMLVRMDDDERDTFIIEVRDYLEEFFREVEK